MFGDKYTGPPPIPRKEKGANNGVAPLNSDGKIDAQYIPVDGRVYVNQGNVTTTLGGAIDSTKEYFIDGVIDCTGVSIEIPNSGIVIKGYDSAISKLTCADATYTMFTSPVGGSGNVAISNVTIQVTGVSSQVYNLVSDTGLNSIKMSSVSYLSCTSLGVIDAYGQGLEIGTVRLGGTPELTLKGTWDSYLVNISTVKNIAAGSYSIYKAGVGFVLSTRFRIKQTLDLPAGVSFVDFAPANFTNPSTLQIFGVLITRAGLFDTADSLYTPNISVEALASHWVRNQGLLNTYIGGLMEVAAELETTIVTVNVAVAIVATTWSVADLSHFDNPAVGQLRNLGNAPVQFRVAGDLQIRGTASKAITIRVKVWDNSAAAFVTAFDQQRVINNLVGINDKAFFNISTHIDLDTNDYVYLEVINNTDSSNITLENGSFFRVEER